MRQGVSTLLRGYLGANDLTQDSLMAEVPFCEAVCNIGLQRYKQRKLLAAQVAQAKELSEIGSGTVFKANQ